MRVRSSYIVASVEKEGDRGKTGCMGEMKVRSPCGMRMTAYVKDTGGLQPRTNKKIEIAQDAVWVGCEEEWECWMDVQARTEA